MAAIDAGDLRAGVGEKLSAADLQREHVVGEEARAAAAQLERQRGLARVRGADEGDGVAVPYDRARVEDLESVQQCGERQSLRDEHPLPGALGPSFRVAPQPPSVRREQVRAILGPGDEVPHLRVALDLEVHRVAGAAFVTDELCIMRPHGARCRTLARRDRDGTPGRLRRGPGEERQVDRAVDVQAERGGSHGRARLI